MWIKCVDELPKNDGHVLIYVKKEDRQYVAYLKTTPSDIKIFNVSTENCDQSCDSTAWYNIDDVEYWMPLLHLPCETETN